MSISCLPPSLSFLTFAFFFLPCPGIVLGLVAGIGAPLWYISRTERDEERLEELRAMNRANYSATGEYMTEVGGGGWTVAMCFVVQADRQTGHALLNPPYPQEEIAAVRKPKWTDRR